MTQILDGAIVRRLMEEEGLSQRAVAARLDVHPSTVSRALSRCDAGDSSVRLSGADSAAFYGLSPEDLADGEALMRRRGFDPADWRFSNASITEWGRDPETGAPYQRLKIDVKRRLKLANLLVPEPLAPIAPPKVEHVTDRPRVGFVLPDPHAPFHDPGAMACFLAFCRDVQPDFGIFSGDVLDLPEPSRHRRNPAWHCTPQESIRAGYRDILAPTREALPNAELDVIVGNHDVRIRNWLLERQPDLADLCAADSDVPVLSVRNLLALDKLHIGVVEPLGEYSDGQLVVCRNLTVTHGEKTGKYNAVDEELDSYGHSVMFGHTHRKRTVYRTRFDMDGPATSIGVNLGCMCLIDGGLGYTRRPNWQQGFGVVTVWPDGTFHIEHADYVNGRLIWRDRQWRA